ncbi:CDP-alcohol phosphatidyltransferase family protein [Azotobacter vinelandii]|uniref:CDP-alcohol phosphatidyltransferase family protein n=1 Tax=Azotobacter vinelandii TaxID=354 RepID=UPI000B20EDE9|nr:CDP-alcohol phosphatidyltransferase family protein [Azotobacter vinelandii]WKN21315.1 CDP-alcohol phosphatidyltransferase family protein [Azotobacter vinelandii]
MLRKHPRARLCGPDEALPQSGDVLLLREDYLYDPRVLRGLLDAQEVALQDPRDGSIVAARLAAESLAGTPRLDGPALDGLRRVRPDTVASGLQAQLRKFDPPWVTRITEGEREHLEKSLFNGAYKGVTDFITRGVWPVPARWVTTWCVRLGLSPNQVTAASYVLAILAGYWFWQGQYGAGLIAGWIMTFLDTVDGKLARVTVTSTRFGNIFDHALDLVHPPIWYVAWGMGLGAAWGFDTPLATVLWIIFAGYVAGRLCEGAFKFAAPFSLFLWRPFDSLNRLVTARRNPNLLILTLAWALGADDVGLLLVALWTVVSTLVLGARVLWALLLRWRGADLQPWLSQIDLRAEGHRPIVRLFAPRSGLSDA